MTTSKKDAHLASKQLRTGKTKAERSVAGSDLAQAKRPAARKPATRPAARRSTTRSRSGR